ncbi:MAG: DUF192 domain-containing protein [Balneolaceae bacterium]
MYLINSTKIDSGIRYVPASFLTLLFCITLWLGVSCSQQRDGEEDKPTGGRDLEYTSEVTFLNSAGEVVSTIEAAVADDEASRSAGLMNVQQLPMDKGMLFIFESQQPRSFWMANTPLALDIIFVDENFEIVRIHQNTQPYSNQSIESEEPAKYVIETNAGYTLRYDIMEEMRVEIQNRPGSGNELQVE